MNNSEIEKIASPEAKAAGEALVNAMLPDINACAEFITQTNEMLKQEVPEQLKDWNNLDKVTFLVRHAFYVGAVAMFGIMSMDAE